MDWWIQTDTGLGTPQSGTKAGSYQATSRWAGHPARPHIEDQPTSAAPKKGANPAGHSQDGIDPKKLAALFKISLARFSSRFSCSSSFSLAASLVLKPGT